MPDYPRDVFPVQNFRFEPRLWPTLAMLVGVLLFAKLGLWQAGKAEARAADIAQFNARARLGPFALTGGGVNPAELQDAPVIVKGVFEPPSQFYVDNRQENDVAGVHVVTPLRIEGSSTRVLVNRGWVAWPGGSRKALPPVQTPEGVVAVEGIATVPVNKRFLLMPEHAESLPRLWPRLDLERFTAEQRYRVEPLVLLQTSPDAGTPLVRHWPPPEDRVARHQSYAYQWWGMALALLIFDGAATVRRRTTP
jgi:surfeit locus 1 family protein